MRFSIITLNAIAWSGFAYFVLGIGRHEHAYAMVWLLALAGVPAIAVLLLTWLGARLIGVGRRTATAPAKTTSTGSHILRHRTLLRYGGLFLSGSILLTGALSTLQLLPEFAHEFRWDANTLDRAAFMIWFLLFLLLAALIGLEGLVYRIIYDDEEITQVSVLFGSAKNRWDGLAKIGSNPLLGTSVFTFRPTGKINVRRNLAGYGHLLSIAQSKLTHA